MNKEKIWDFWAKRYERLWVQKISLGPTRREVLKSLEKILKKDQKYSIIDVGCGIGQTLREIEQKFQNYNIELSGIDFSKEMINRAKASGEEINYRQMNVKEINMLKKQFDVVICTHSFPYYGNQENVIRDFRNIIKDEGYLLLAQASQNSFYDSLAMFFVKFTTGKAKYPGVNEILKMAKNLFQCKEVIKIKERFYMPSIYLFVLKGTENEYFTN